MFAHLLIFHNPLAGGFDHLEFFFKSLFALLELIPLPNCLPAVRRFSSVVECSALGSESRVRFPSLTSSFSFTYNDLPVELLNSSSVPTLSASLVWW